MKLKVTSNEVQQVEYDMSNDPALHQGYDDEDEMDYLSESDKKLMTLHKSLIECYGEKDLHCYHN